MVDLFFLPHAPSVCITDDDGSTGRMTRTIFLTNGILYDNDVSDTMAGEVARPSGQLPERFFLRFFFFPSHGFGAN